MIINVKLKVFLGALMIRSLRVFEISLTTCKICENNSAEKLISEPVLKVLHYLMVSTVYFEGARESTDELFDDKKRVRKLSIVR